MYFFLCFQGLASLYAQVDKTFWFAVPEVTNLHADRPIFLQLASNAKASEVLISVPANSSFIPLSITLGANELKSVDLTNFIDELENTELDKAVNKGLLIEATEEITAYYEVQGTSPTQGIVNIDIFSLKGENALGTEFYLPFQTDKGNNYNHYGKDGWSSADIVATEDDTQVIIELTKDAVGHAANTTFTITLQKGQTYSLRADGQKAEDRLVGTYVSSTKPIAITIKDDSVAESQTVQFTAADLIGDQLIPVNIIGTEYILAEGTAYVLATEDNTTLEVNGVAQTPLNRGKQKAINLLSTPTFIKSSKPVYVLHTISQSGEYGGAIVPPTQCTGSQKVSFIRPEGQGFELTVLIKNGGEDSFVINGKKSIGLTKGAFQEVPNTNGEWLYASRDLNELNVGANTIENTTREFHLGIKSRTKGASFYGYFSNFGNLDLGLDFQACQGDDIVLSAGEGRDSYEWSTGSTDFSIVLSSQNVVKDSLIWVKVIEGQCQAQDTVFVTVGEAVTGIDLGNDIELCEGDNHVIPLPSTYTYTWNENEATQDTIYTITTGGWYKLIASSQDGCTYTDSIFATVVPLPIANLGNDTLICSGEQLSLQLTEGYNSYEWNTGNNTNSLEISEEGIYSVKVITQTKDKICGIAQDEVTVGFWNVHTYNVLTPNDDGENDVFIVDGIEKGDWILEVYNRWGQRVYYDKHYANTWNPEVLTEGTYFFSLMESQKASCNQFNNWVQIIK